MVEEAASKGHFDIARLLLRAGANLDVVPDWANTAGISQAVDSRNGGAKRLFQQAKASSERGGETLWQRLWDMEKTELQAVLRECGVSRADDTDDE